MSLTSEWRRRIETWIAELGGHCFVSLGRVDLEGFVTRDRLPPDEAGRRNFAPMPVGSRWGEAWEYGWFRAQIELPEEVRGERIVLRLGAGAEGLVFVDGVAAGGLDREHGQITLARSARGGERFGVLAEFYAGHGAIEEDIGPVSPGRVVQPLPFGPQRTVGPSEWGEWDDLAFGLLADAETLRQTRSVLPESSLRVSEIDEGLRDFATIVDFELPRPAMRETFGEARARLSPLLGRINGPTAPTMHIFGNSHLDLAWKWPFEETIRKAARTISTQLALMEEYPEYRFLWCQVPLFEVLRDHYPELWGRLKSRVAEGRVLVEGGMWLESDTNLPWGEALVRQIALAKVFFQKEFGLDTRVLWLPDSFGFSAALPQIMKLSGLDYFATKKLADGYNDSDPFPLVTFEWGGLDGSSVLAHVYRKCNSPIDPQTFARRWDKDRPQKDGISSYLFPFGYGDGGGGPTREHLEFARRLADLEGLPRARWSSPREFFEAASAESAPEAHYQGELYFPEHRGTYTSQARTKRANRLAEVALREAEFWSTAAHLLAGEAWPAEELRDAWRKLLFCHFHDVITGASIASVQGEANSQLEEARAQATALSRAARRRLSTFSDTRGDHRGPPLRLGSRTNCLVLFNSLPWERSALVRLPDGSKALLDASGLPLPAQTDATGTWARVKLPGAGWKSFPTSDMDIHHSLDPQAPFPGGTRSSAPEVVSLRREGGRFVLENPYLRVVVGPDGQIPSVFDKESGLELASAPCNEFRLYKDVPANYDAWDIDTTYLRTPVALSSEGSEMEVVADGPLFAALRLTRPLSSSLLVQEIRLEGDAHRIEFHSRIDWREDHKLLKVAFPTRLRADEALYEIQFGHVRRPTHRNRRHDADRFEGCHHRWVALAETSRGVAVLNDCKYGSSAEGGTICLTLLRAPFVPDPGADRGAHEFSYALMSWNGDFASRGPVRAGYEFNAPVSSVNAALAGGVSSGFSLLDIDAPSVILETLKTAEDRSGDLILRFYESSGNACRVKIRLGFEVEAASLADLLEGEVSPCPLDDATVGLEFRAFEIKTLRIRPGSPTTCPAYRR